MNIRFLGAAQEVTGSCYHIDTGDLRFLVDCGMVQGGREGSARNRKPFDFDPRTIDFVLLTHAHIDHSGLLPKLTRDGFSGPIYTTHATADLLGVMLPDSAHIQETDAARAKRKSRQGRAPGPIYTMQNARDCLRQVEGVRYEEFVDPGPGVRCRFQDAGHIIGSAIIEVWVTQAGKTTKLVFSGDLGQPNRPILRDPVVIEEADILLIESTYGNREHPNQHGTVDLLAEIVRTTLKGGNIVVPAFAVGRTQEILYHLNRLTYEGQLEEPKVFVDSPMATEATRITREHLHLFDEEAKKFARLYKAGVGLSYLRFTGSVEESQAINQIRSGAIIISASGMCEAGRIRHHLRQNLPRRECAVMITGFQAEGTLGRRLVEGAKRVRLFGEDVPVRAAIHILNGFSAHADRTALLDWASGFKTPPRQTFVVHGEITAATDFAETLRTDKGWHVTVPGRGETFDLG
ncbi:MAG: MBL fold metallo-hydrolase [Spongiibacteraceae bacterium]|jgi:metallo-beta-lactamase family protein|nr:MBL fold metallo-hydrolase [Spongiibacteraceae bacterium]